MFFIHHREATYRTSFISVIDYSGSIEYLEHVNITITVVVDNSTFYGKRGDIGIELTSPYGTVSTLLGYRYRDSDFNYYYHYYYDYYDYYDYDVRNDEQGYFEWPFMSVMFWGEDPTGEWTLNITTQSSNTNVDVCDINFQFFGVSSRPESVAKIPAECHPDCLQGCAQPSSNFCDACVNLRNAYTLECIDTCPLGYTEHNGYCYDRNILSEECISPLKDKAEGWL